MHFGNLADKQRLPWHKKLLKIMHFLLSSTQTNQMRERNFCSTSKNAGSNNGVTLAELIEKINDKNPILKCDSAGC